MAPITVDPVWIRLFESLAKTFNFALPTKMGGDKPLPK
jgi:hypothetical protein